MKPSLVVPVAFALLMLTACVGDPPEIDSSPNGVPDGGPIQFTVHTVSAGDEGCEDPASACARVHMEYVECETGGSLSARDNIDIYVRHFLVSRLRAQLPESVGSRLISFDELAAAFLAHHRAFVADFPDTTARWFIEISAELAHNTSQVATIDLSETTFTGGAHPNANRRLVSFDIASGRLLGLDDLCIDPEAFAAIAERQFRLARNIGPEASLEQAGFFLDDGRLPLPDDVGIVAGGLLLHWNPYEIAPYAAGPSTLTIPPSELEGVVVPDYW
jgi:hypothetical protein